MFGLGEAFVKCSALWHKEWKLKGPYLCTKLPDSMATRKTPPESTGDKGEGSLIKDFVSTLQCLKRDSGDACPFQTIAKTCS